MKENDVRYQHMELRFSNSQGAQLTTEEVVAEIGKFMQEAPQRCYKVIIGSDSQQAGGKTADFVTAIVVHRIGNGGRYFWRRVAENSNRHYHTLRQRITEEVVLSLNVAHTLMAAVKEKSIPQFDFEIHVDVGENGDTRAIIQELVGMVRANNFEAKTKPESYAASSVADRHV